MGAKLRYVPNSYYRVDDLTGFVERAENTRKTWQGYYVRPKSFENRNIQDFVRGRRDNQIAPGARPRQAQQFIGLESTLSQTALIRATVIYLVNPISVVPGNTIAIILDDGTNFWVEVIALALGGAWASGFGSAFSSEAAGAGDFSSDFDSDFSMGGPIAIALAQPLPCQASSGNLVQNLSAPEVSLTNALSSVS